MRFSDRWRGMRVPASERIELLAAVAVGAALVAAAALAMEAPAAVRALLASAGAGLALAPAGARLVGGRRIRGAGRAAIERSFAALIEAVEDVRARLPIAAAGWRAETRRARRIERLRAAVLEQRLAVEGISGAIEAETAGIGRLLAEQAETAALLRSNLERRMAPLLEYAAALEANIALLQARAAEAGSELPPAIRLHIEDQRRHGIETRARIDAMRRPFEDYLRWQREGTQAVLAPFDADLQELHATFARQRRVLKRVLESVRSEPFGEAVGYLSARTRTLRELAEAGASDPAAFETVLTEIEVAAGSPYADAVLDALGRSGAYEVAGARAAAEARVA